MQIDMNNIWTLFRLAAHFAKRKNGFTAPKPEERAANHCDYTKRIHRQGHGWKVNHEGNV